MVCLNVNIHCDVEYVLFFQFARVYMFCQRSGGSATNYLTAALAGSNGRLYSAISWGGRVVGVGGWIASVGGGLAQCPLTVHLTMDTMMLRGFTVTVCRNTVFE